MAKEISELVVKYHRGAGGCFGTVSKNRYFKNRENPDDFKYYGNSNLGDILELRESGQQRHQMEMGL